MQSSILRLVRNPRDRVAGFRVLQLIPGIGPKAAGLVLDALDLAPDPLAALEDVAPPPRAGADWPGFVEAMRSKADWPAALGNARAWYEPHLERMHEDAEARRADLMQLEQIATGYPNAEAFLTELTLDPPDATSDKSGVPLKDEDYLILSTIHSAKGQEWKSVYLLNAVDGCIPSDLGTGSTHELEEERRLAYVGVTRARERLYLSRAVVRSAWGAPSHNPASRFLDEMPVDLVDWRRTEGAQTRWSRPDLSGSLGAPGGGMGSPTASGRRNFSAAAARADAASKSRKRDRPVPSLAAGDRVTHDSFGLGTVVSVEGEADRAVASIDFGSDGVKRLLLRYAPVEKL